jgi:hypothetical protein
VEVEAFLNAGDSVRTVAKKTGRSKSDVGRIRQAAVERGLRPRVTTVKPSN